MQKGYIWDHIHITWEEVTIRHAQSEIQVRQYMSVPLIDRIRMRRISPHSVDYSFMVQQGGTLGQDHPSNCRKCQEMYGSHPWPQLHWVQT